MRFEERREHDGTWWGRRQDGSWMRWNTLANDWEGPLRPPWADREPAPIGSVPPSADEPRGSRSRIDAWWNRRYPPLSRRRLAFLLALVPVAAALSELCWVAAGLRASLARYVLVCLAVGGTLASAFSSTLRPYAERLQRILPNPGPARELPPPAPLPPRSFWKDLLIAIPFSLAIFLVMGLTVGDPSEALSPRTIAWYLAGAVVTALVVALRSSVWGLVLFSAIGGVLGAMAMAFLSMMTFSEPSGLWLGWVGGAVVVFVFAWPVWGCLRRLEAQGFALPMWFVMSGATLLVAGSAVVFAIDR
jgi:hypothetical protein